LALASIVGALAHFSRPFCSRSCWVEEALEHCFSLPTLPQQGERASGPTLRAPGALVLLSRARLCCPPSRSKERASEEAERLCCPPVPQQETAKRLIRSSLAARSLGGRRRLRAPGALVLLSRARLCCPPVPQQETAERGIRSSLAALDTCPGSPANSLRLHSLRFARSLARAATARCSMRSAWAAS
jgi:hypothetical protein